MFGAMPEHRHLQRLAVVFARQPVFFITTCVRERRPVLAQSSAAQILVEEWQLARQRHGWQIGRYVIMPDHVHFFATPENDNARLTSFVSLWKQWTAKRIVRDCGIESPFWQPRFFDHLLRTEESYADKREYVLNNPVRAELVAKAEDWPFSGWIDFK
jgi:REP element-mobilizing transposase RayT